MARRSSASAVFSGMSDTRSVDCTRPVPRVGARSVASCVARRHRAHRAGARPVSDRRGDQEIGTTASALLRGACPTRSAWGLPRTRPTTGSARIGDEALIPRTCGRLGDHLGREPPRILCTPPPVHQRATPCPGPSGPIARRRASGPVPRVAAGPRRPGKKQPDSAARRPLEALDQVLRRPALAHLRIRNRTRWCGQPRMGGKRGSSDSINPVDRIAAPDSVSAVD